MHSSLFVAIFVVLALGVEGREHWLESRQSNLHSNRSYLSARRVGQEQISPATKLGGLAGCPVGICPILEGQAIAPLLAGADACAQQNHADAIINAAKDATNGIADQATRTQMIQIAVEYRQAERNTPPTASGQPVQLRNSVFCQKAPANPELNGLVQAQDPANDPTLFFDPAVTTNGGTVVLGSQANTAPFKG